MYPRIQMDDDESTAAVFAYGSVFAINKADVDHLIRVQAPYVFYVVIRHRLLVKAPFSNKKTSSVRYTFVSPYAPDVRTNSFRKAIANDTHSETECPSSH